MNYYEKYLKYKIKYLALKRLKDNSIINVKTKQIKDVYKDANSENYNKLKFTKESLYSMDRVHGSSFLLKVIKKYFPKLDNLILTDGTANVGSVSINLANYFKSVNSIELSPINYEGLVNNIKVLKKNNINTYLANTNTKIHELKQDIIYIDAPWTGPDYKKEEIINLFLDKVSIDEFYINSKGLAKLFIFKVPINYDISKLNKVSKIKVYHYYKYKILKYYLIVIDNR